MAAPKKPNTQAATWARRRKRRWRNLEAMAERLTEAGCSVVDFYSLVPSEDHTIRLMFRRANTDEWFSYDIGELEYNVPMWYTERGAELRIAELVEHGFEVMRPTT